MAAGFDPFEGLLELFVCCRNPGHSRSRGLEFSDYPYQEAFDASDICGIGIIFRPDTTGALRVTKVVPGGPAAQVGVVKDGDVLYEIDGETVYRWPAGKVTPRLFGQRRSVVKIAFLRQDRVVDVALVRDLVDEIKSQVMDEDLDRVSTPTSFNSLQRRTHSPGSSQKHDSPEMERTTTGIMQPIFTPGYGGAAPRVAAFKPVNQETIDASARVAAAMERTRDSRGAREPTTDPEELEKIKQKLERQERWASKLGASLSPRTRPDPEARAKQKNGENGGSSTDGAGGESPESAMSRKGTEDVLDKESLEHIKKKLDSQDRWIKKIFAQVITPVISAPGMAASLLGIGFGV